MLYEANQMDQLGAYVQQMKDAELSRWWGRYCESIGDTTAALEVFQQASDTLALVRLHCSLGDFVAASNLVEDSNDAAAAFLLARQLEATEQVCHAQLHLVDSTTCSFELTGMFVHVLAERPSCIAVQCWGLIHD